MESLKVIKLYIRNYLGIKAVEIKPEGDVIRIEGKNGSGKSSAVGSIWTGIGGKKALPVHALRNGTKDGEISLDLDELKVEVKFTPKGSYLEVRGKDGAKVSSPQSLLDTFYTETSFDPQAFIDMKSSDRCELLLKLTGKREQITALDREYKAVYDERTAVNRNIRDVEGKLVDAPHNEILPEIEDKEKSVSELTARLTKAKESDFELSVSKNHLQTLREQFKENTKRILDIEDEITKLSEEKLKCGERIDSCIKEIEKFEKQIESAPPSQIPAIQSEIDSADEYNADIRKRKADRENRIRAIQAANELRGDKLDFEADSETLSNRLKRIIDEKGEILSSAKLGVPGLTIDAGEILINGVPFDDLSTKERIVASMHIGISQNPKLRVLRIENGRELDSESMAEVEKFAAENDCQIWIETVEDYATGKGIFIEEGEVKENNV